MMQKCVLRGEYTYVMVASRGLAAGVYVVDRGVDHQVCDGGKSGEMWSNGSLSSQR